jgi:hypothetical protein
MCYIDGQKNKYSVNALLPEYETEGTSTLQNKDVTAQNVSLLHYTFHRMISGH